MNQILLSQCEQLFMNLHASCVLGQQQIENGSLGQLPETTERHTNSLRVVRLEQQASLTGQLFGPCGPCAVLTAWDGRMDATFYAYGVRLYFPAGVHKLAAGVIHLFVGNKSMWTSPVWNSCPFGALWGGMSEREGLKAPQGAGMADSGVAVQSYAWKPRIRVAARQNLQVVVSGVDLAALTGALGICLIGRVVRDVA